MRKGLSQDVTCLQACYWYDANVNLSSADSLSSVLVPGSQKSLSKLMILVQMNFNTVKKFHQSAKNQSLQKAFDSSLKSTSICEINQELAQLVGESWTNNWKDQGLVLPVRYPCMDSSALFGIQVLNSHS